MDAILPFPSVEQVHSRLTGEGPAPLSRAAGSPFADALSDALGSVVGQWLRAARAPLALAAGRNDDLVGTMLEVQRASLSVSFALEVRNRLMDAYHDVMRMTI